MQTRTDSYERLSALLARTDDASLRALLTGTESTDGWGTHRVLDMHGAAVFAKTVPLTAREQAQPGSTGNLFGLPTFYSYGVGSGGFGVWRELAMHHKTTAWVLDGAIDTFPLLLHHRVLPISAPHKAMSRDELDEYVEYWDGSEEIRQFILARQAATHEVVFFLEHVPHVLRTWLGSDPDRIALATDAMARTTAFLRTRGVVHFDAHFGNILSDGERVFLTDFGLALDREFDLSQTERAFLDAHDHFDAGTFIRCLCHALRALGGDLPADTLATLRRYEPVSSAMDRVFAALRSGPKHAAAHDDDELAGLLSATGWPGVS